MSIRSLGPLLTRRLLSPRSGISRAQAKKALAPAAGVPARSLHSLRDFAVGDGAGAYGGVAAAALAGLVGILYFRKGADESAGEVTKEVVAVEEDTKEVTKVVVAGEKEIKEVTRQEAKKQLAGDEARKQGAIIEAETKEHNDDFSLEEYLAEMTKIAAAQKKARYDSDGDWDDYIDHIRSLIDKKNARAKKPSRD